MVFKIYKNPIKTIVLKTENIINLNVLLILVIMAYIKLFVAAIHFKLEK